MLLCACAMSAAIADPPPDTAVITVSVICDPSPPTGSVSINGAAPWTTRLDATLTLEASDPISGVAEMRFSNGTAWSLWEPYATTKSWILAAGSDGVRNVYAQFKDGAGNVATITDDITLDTTPPVCEKIVSGKSDTRAALFTVTFSEDVVNFDAPDDVVVHITGGVTYSGILIAGGPRIYTVEVLDLAGDGSFTLAASTASDVEDLAGSALASSVTSNQVIVSPGGVPVLGLAGMAVLLGLIAITSAKKMRKK